MGMAASQARLLTITARLADNELRSQTINNAKMRLATQSSQASQNYINALNNATMKFANYDLEGEALTQNLTYNALTAYSPYNTQYGLVNSSGQLLVSEEEAALFNKAGGNLNSYLKYHGLEYTTTYFEEAGARVNENYPAPFNYIGIEEMKSYYEQYSSYENSIEVENYEKKYNTYVSAKADLERAAFEQLENYMTYSGNSPQITKDKKYTMNYTATSLTGIYDQVIGAFGNVNTQNNNTYSFYNLAKLGLLNETDLEAISAQFGAYSKTTVPVQNPTTGITFYQTQIKETKPCSIENESDDTGNYYILDGHTKIYVDGDNNVLSYTNLLSDEQKSRQGYSFTYPEFDASTKLDRFIAGIQAIQAESGEDGSTYNVTYNYSYNSTENSCETYTLISQPEVLKEMFNSLINSVMTHIVSSSNYENFADFLLEQNELTLRQYGIYDQIGKNGKTISATLDEYREAKDEFFSQIFQDKVVEDGVVTSEVSADLDGDGVEETYESSKALVEYALKNGYGDITLSSLLDVDYVLCLIKNYGLTQSESFNTIIKQALVENMVDELGEPKYAWVDENDTSNTGNADAKAQWYTNLFNRMMKGYKALEKGLASSPEWIEFALESGIVAMEQVNKSFLWKTLDYKTCTRITEETDNEAVAKAEAEYNRAMNDIKAKDNIYDLQLKNIDTEHTSLQTEYDVIKGVISKNIDRNFKFNQNA